MAAKKKAGNYSFLKSYTYYVPGVADMFILLLWLLVGALLGNLVSLAFTAVLGSGSSAVQAAMLVSYPLMFIPAMIYSSTKSRVNSMNQRGVMLDSNHFKPVGGVICVILVSVITVALAFCADAAVALLPEMPKFLEDLLKNMTQGNIWTNFISVSIFAPLFEEWLCRGMVLRGLLANRIRPVWAIVISAVFFAFIHANPWQAVPAFLIGCLMGFVYYKTGSLKLTMLMHFVNNTFALVIGNIDSLKDCDNWREILPGPEYWVIFAACLLLMALAIRRISTVEQETETGNCDVVPSMFEAE